MPLIDYPDLNEIDEQLYETLKQVSEQRGEEVIDSFPHMLSHNPAVLESIKPQFFEVMYGGNLDPDLKQMAFVVVSQENACSYCAAAHGAELVNVFGLSATYLDALAREDYAEFTDRQRAVVEFARQAATDPNRIGEEHIEALQAVGFDDADVIELLAVVGEAAFANTIVNALNIRPSDQSAELERYYPKEFIAPE